MQNAVATSQFSRLTRLMIAFIFGLVLGPYPFIPPELQLAISIIIPLGAMVLSIQFSPEARQGIISPRGVLWSIIILMILTVVLTGLGVSLIVMGAPFTYLGLALLPFTVGAVATFIVGNTGTWRFSAATGAIAWLGMGLHLLLAAYIDQSSNRNSAGGNIIVTLALIFTVTGLAVAAPGGIVGQPLRHWLLRR